MRTFLLFTRILPLIFFALSCSGSGDILKPTVSGKAGEVIVVMSKANWESEPGTDLRSILAVDYPYLPQKEPAFTLINITEKDFSSIFQVHRNIIILKTDPKYSEATMVTQEDIWAAPQTVITITAPNAASASELIEKKKDIIFNTLSQAERNRVIRNSKRYEEVSLRKMAAEEYGGSPYFPKGYSLKKKSDDFTWISYETTYTNQGIFMYKIPYKDSTSMSIDNLIKARNEVMQKNVLGMLDNSYMTTSSEVTPSLNWIKYKGRDFAEMRGFWEVKNDFMGGPFVSHAFYDKNSNNIIVLEGFVYAPRYDKRNYLRQVESILYSFDWKEDFNK